MSTISTIETSGLPEVVVLRTNRIGKVVSVRQIGDVGQMLELAFDGQMHTECFWDSETQIKANQEAQDDAQNLADFQVQASGRLFI